MKAGLAYFYLFFHYLFLLTPVSQECTTSSLISRKNVQDSNPLATVVVQLEM